MKSWNNVKQGDYVLATKWNDGDPEDHWCVGFYDRFDGERHFVTDEHGNQFRANGFRRVARISAKRGAWILGQKCTSKIQRKAFGGLPGVKCGEMN